MPVLAHKKPCKNCPWNRKSVPGYLGASTTDEFIQTALGEVEMPCHCAIDYEKKDWETTQYPTAPLCAGALTFLRNTCKLPRSSKLADAVREVGSDHVNVFSNIMQFKEHHK